jgi:hypothetical protein
MTFRELWRIAGGTKTFVLCACAKLLRVRIRFDKVTTLVETVGLIDLGQVPDHVQKAWTPQLELCREQGFRLVCYYQPDVLPSLEFFTAAFFGGWETDFGSGDLRGNQGQWTHRLRVSVTAGRIQDPQHFQYPSAVESALMDGG